MAIPLPEFEAMLVELCHASLAARDAKADVPACAQLIEEVVAQGREAFVRAHTQSPGASEVRLNGAGLKLEYEVDFYRNGEDTRVYVGKIKIGGDQVEDYPAFVRVAEPILESGNGEASSVARLKGAAA